MKYHCEKCNIHFNYPKWNGDTPTCPQCGATAVENPKETTANSSGWYTVAVFILALGIISALVIALYQPLSGEGVNWVMVGVAVGDLAFTTLLCGIVILLDDISATLKINTALIMSKE